MAGDNKFSKEERVFFEEVLEGFNPNNITAKQVDIYKVPMKAFERSALKIERPIPYVSIPQEGLTKTDAQFVGMTELTVPSELNANATTPSDIKNVPFHMNAVELNDPTQREKKKRSIILALSAKVDNSIATLIANQGTLFIKDTVTTGIKTYAQIVACEEAMTIRDIPLEDERTLIMNPADYNRAAGDLADGRKVLTGHGEDAYMRSKVPDIGTFNTFKANFQPTLALSPAAGAALIDGANQKHVPSSTVDNRYMNLTVNGTTTDPKVGDAFKINGVNSVSMIHKNNTGQPQTFRIIKVTSSTVWVISPAIVVGEGTYTPAITQPEKEYANCSVAPADDAAITFLNTVDAPTNIFWKKSSVEIIHGSLSREELDGNAGVASMLGETDSGLEILISKASDILTLQTKYRLDMWYRPNILNEQMCGVLVGLQT